MKDKKPRKLRGFTLIEILIASTIFASIMVMTASVLSQTGNYQIKLKSSREVLNGAQLAADLISRDIRETQGGLSVRIGSETYAKGFILLDCSDGNCTPSYNRTSLSSNNFCASPAGVNTLILFSPTNFKIYYLDGAGVLYYRRIDAAINSQINETTNLYNYIMALRLAENKVSQNSDVLVFGLFSGFAPSVSTAAEARQPFIKFSLRTETPNYDALQPNRRSRTNLCSSVTSRNYD